MNAEILLRNGVILTVNDRSEIIENGSLLIRGAKIEKIYYAGDELPEVSEVIDCGGKLIIPGLINTHAHSPMVLFRGMADDMNLHEWLTGYIFPAEAKYVDRAFVYAGARLAIAEMILSGTTCFNDMYFFEDEIARAAREAGIRCVISESLIDYPTPNAKTPEEGFGILASHVRDFANDELVTVAVGVHAPYTCSETLLKDAKRFADENKLLINIHLSETKKESDDMKAKNSLSPTAYLESIGFLDSNVVAAHCVEMSDEDIDLMKSREAGAALCPQSNAKLVSGIARFSDMHAAGVKVGIGTDGAASNNNLDMLEEIDFGAKMYKLGSGDATKATAQELFAAATIGGARVLGMSDKTGSIEEGKLADIAILDLQSPHLQPVYDYYSMLVYSACGSDVRHVIINGKSVMRDGKLVTLDLDNVIREAMKIRKTIQVR